MDKLSFSLETAYQSYVSDKNSNLADPVTCKKYITDHIFPIRGGSYLVFEDGVPINYDCDNIKRTYFNKLDKSISKWFFNEYRGLFTVVCEINKPMIYENNINMCPLFMHKQKPYNEYSEAIKKKVELWLSYMLNVLASGRKDALDYIIKCYSKIAKGEKIDSCLYFRSPEGCGKSKNTDFLINYVFGKKLSIISNSEPLKTVYNKVLLGKLLVVFEELECMSQREWEGMSSRLKQMITGSTLMYRNLYEKPFEAKNINNYIINTNVEAIQHSEGRRYFCVDVSTKYKGDTKYFAHLTQECMNDEVGEAFYNYLLSIDTTNFHCQGDMPETNNKLDAINDRLPVEYRFLKENYILLNRKLHGTVGEIYEEYRIYCTGEDKTALTKTKFCAKLREINIDYSVSNKHNVYRVAHETLLNIAQQGKWIHKLDEFNTNKAKQSSDDTIDFDMGIPDEKQDIIDKQAKQIEELKKQIEELKAQTSEAGQKKSLLVKPIAVIAEQPKEEPEEPKPSTKRVKVVKPKTKKKTVSSANADELLLTLDDMLESDDQ